MRVLAIDTCLAACSAAIVDTERALASHRLERRATGHAEALLVMVRDCAAEAGIALRDIERIAVTRGPGTFTGVRIGVSAARALALATGAPIVATTSLAVIAAGVVRGAAPGRAMMVVAPGPRGDLFVEVIGADGSSSISPATVRPPAEIIATMDPSLLVIGPGAAALAALARGHGLALETAFKTALPDARELALLAPSLVPLSTPLTPLYLRPADARPQADKALARQEPPRA